MKTKMQPYHSLAPVLSCRRHCKTGVARAQVMSESADACAAALVHHCHSHKLLLQICTRLSTDRCAKLRIHCAGYLLQVINCSPSTQEGKQDASGCFHQSNSSFRNAAWSLIAALKFLLLCLEHSDEHWHWDS